MMPRPCCSHPAYRVLQDERGLTSTRFAAESDSGPHAKFRFHRHDMPVQRPLTHTVPARNLLAPVAANNEAGATAAGRRIRRPGPRARGTVPLRRRSSGGEDPHRRSAPFSARRPRHRPRRTGPGPREHQSGARDDLVRGPLGTEHCPSDLRAALATLQRVTCAIRPLVPAPPSSTGELLHGLIHARTPMPARPPRRARHRRHGRNPLCAVRAGRVHPGLARREPAVPDGRC